MGITATLIPPSQNPDTGELQPSAPQNQEGSKEYEYKNAEVDNTCRSSPVHRGFHHIQRASLWTDQCGRGGRSSRQWPKLRSKRHLRIYRFREHVRGNPFGFPVGVLSTNGTLTLDGNGNWIVREVEVVNGQVFNPAATFAGTYTLNPDCTFAAMITGVPEPVFVGVVVDHGNQIRAMGTTPGEQINYVSTIKVKNE